MENADVSSIVNKSLKSLKIPDDIVVSVHSAPTTIRCDSKQLETAFTNLIRNAVEALEGKGAISIQIEDKDDSVHFEIEDSDSGVPTELMGKVFDPLFTTKQTGTGLGLVSCKNIVEQHGENHTIK